MLLIKNPQNLLFLKYISPQTEIIKFICQFCHENNKLFQCNNLFRIGRKLHFQDTTVVHFTINCQLLGHLNLEVWRYNKIIFYMSICCLSHVEYLVTLTSMLRVMRNCFYTMTHWHSPRTWFVESRYWENTTLWFLIEEINFTSLI